MESGEIEPTKLAAVPFQTMVEELQAKTPGQALTWLVTDAENEPNEIAQALEGLTPIEAAAHLLEEINVKIRMLESA